MESQVEANRANFWLIIRAIVRMAVTTAVLFALYLFVPLDVRPHETILFRVGITLVVFIAISVWELRAIINHSHPKLRAVTAMSLILPLFIFMFAWMYVNYSITTPGSFSQELSRTSAFYFTITIFSTVGFGDITPINGPAQLIVSLQMIADLILLAVGFKLIFGAAERGIRKQTSKRIPEESAS